MRVGIVTDSTCDLPAATLLRLGVAAVPLRVRIGEQVHRDWRDIEPAALYEQMESNGVMPVTSPPDAEDFVLVYERYLAAYDVIISVHLSGALSETVARAREAVALLGAEDRITVVDSRQATAPLAEMVIEAATQAADGADLDQILWHINRMRDSLYTLICPDSLKWLLAGGRIGRTQLVMGNLFGVRPIITIDDGAVVPAGRTRHGATISTLVSKLTERFVDIPIHLTLFFAGQDRDSLEQLKRATEEAGLDIVSGRVQLLGPVIGSHLGPRTLGLCAYPEIVSIFE